MRKRSPKIYVYTEPQFASAKWEGQRQGSGLLKVGYTARDVDKRMREHFPTNGPTKERSALIRDAKAGRFTHVIAVDLDRLIRTTKDLVLLIDLGLKVVTVDGEIDLSTADGELRATMLAGMARFETRRKSERQVRANIARVELGRPTPGRRRYGYESDGTSPRESEAEWVRKIFNSVAAGESLRSVVKSLIANEISPAPGKEWSPRRIRDMIFSPPYVGMIKYRGAVIPTSSIQPIVDSRTAEKARALLSNPSRRTTPGPKAKHLMSGIATCGECGSPMYYMRGYLCSKSTSHVHIKKDLLETAVLAQLYHWLSRQDGKGTGANPETTQILHEQLAELNRQREVVQKLAQMPGADLSLARRELNKLGLAIASLELELESQIGDSVRIELSRSTIENFRWPPGEAESAKTDMPPKRQWLDAWADLSLERQRDLIRFAFVTRVHKGRGSDRVKFHEHKRDS